MAREHWRDLLEGIGFLAIVASLIFVGIETSNSTEQTRLNTQALEISAYQELMNNISEINALSVEERRAADIAAPLYGAHPDDWGQIAALYTIFRHGDMAFFMFERGVIDEDRLHSALQPLPIAGEIGRDFWNERKTAFVQPYQDYVDGLIKQGFWERHKIPN